MRRRHARCHAPSLPAWGRGLKRRPSNSAPVYYQSLPAWGRGLKPLKSIDDEIGSDVAPRVGAWIETP